ncbi:MAG: ABC transporter permease [Ectothiorhodospiraceae bacterium]|nr:ABC transporter permease [Ectothiorhodospiraceae bacterium]
MFVLPEKPAGFSEAEGYLLDARYDKENHRVVAAEILGDYPGWSFPYIPGLGERAKIIFFHVPMSWMTVIAFLVSMWFGIKYLRKKNLIDDAKSAYAAGLGLLFCILATVTGSVWAQFNWGTFWNWDPRETSIFVLLLIYGAYFTLRSAIEVDEKRARLSAVYSILAFVTVPFFIFIMPRILPGLHPGSADDVNAGPVVSSGGMDAGMRVILYSMLLGCIVLFGWLMSIQMRVFRITQKQEADDIAAAEAIS